MHKRGPWAPLGAECDAVSELQKKEMNENKLLIRFFIAFFSYDDLMHKMFWYKNVCLHSFPIWLLDFEWRIPDDRFDRDKLFLFAIRENEQLWGAERALIRVNSQAPKKPSQCTHKELVMNCSSYLWKTQGVNLQMQTYNAFSFFLLWWSSLAYFFVGFVQKRWLHSLLQWLINQNAWKLQTIFSSQV